MKGFFWEFKIVLWKTFLFVKLVKGYEIILCTKFSIKDLKKFIFQFQYISKLFKYSKCFTNVKCYNID